MIHELLRSGSRAWRGAFWLCLTACAVLAVMPKPPRLLFVSQGDKFEHALAFAVLAGIGRIAFPRTAGWLLWLALALFGAAIEFVQAIPVLHRDSTFDDWLVDAAIAAVVLGLAALVARPALYGR